MKTNAGAKTYMLIGNKYGEVKECRVCSKWIFKDGEHFCLELIERVIREH